MQNFSLSRRIVTEGQGHSNQCKTIEFSSVYHYAKFERNWFADVQIHANAKGVAIVVSSFHE